MKNIGLIITFVTLQGKIASIKGLLEYKKLKIYACSFLHPTPIAFILRHIKKLYNYLAVCPVSVRYVLGFNESFKQINFYLLLSFL